MILIKFSLFDVNPPWLTNVETIKNHNSLCMPFEDRKDKPHLWQVSVSSVTPLSDCEDGRLPRSYGSRESILSHRKRKSWKQRKEEEEEEERDWERYGTHTGMERHDMIIR